ncbi:unnamed protein product [Amoebophrya sp. A25]|nr:unnamed protein product [Amoebophrya sp. A25]|eukprot:GSA25T00017438001.1
MSKAVVQKASARGAKNASISDFCTETAKKMWDLLCLGPYDHGCYKAFELAYNESKMRVVDACVFILWMKGIDWKKFQDKVSRNVPNRHMQYVMLFTNLNTKFEKICFEKEPEYGKPTKMIVVKLTRDDFAVFLEYLLPLLEAKSTQGCIQSCAAALNTLASNNPKVPTDDPDEEIEVFLSILGAYVIPYEIKNAEFTKTHQENILASEPWKESKDVYERAMTEYPDLMARCPTGVKHREMYQRLQCRRDAALLYSFIYNKSLPVELANDADRLAQLGLTKAHVKFNDDRRKRLGYLVADEDLDDNDDGKDMKPACDEANRKRSRAQSLAVAEASPVPSPPAKIQDVSESPAGSHTGFLERGSSSFSAPDLIRGAPGSARLFWGGDSQSSMHLADLRQGRDPDPATTAGGLEASDSGVLSSSRSLQKSSASYKEKLLPEEEKNDEPNNNNNMMEVDMEKKMLEQTTSSHGVLASTPAGAAIHATPEGARSVAQSASSIPSSANALFQLQQEQQLQVALASQQLLLNQQLLAQNQMLAPGFPFGMSNVMNMQMAMESQNGISSLSVQGLERLQNTNRALSLQPEPASVLPKRSINFGKVFTPAGKTTDDNKENEEAAATVVNTPRESNVGEPDASTTTLRHEPEQPAQATTMHAPAPPKKKSKKTWAQKQRQAQSAEVGFIDSMEKPLEYDFKNEEKFWAAVLLAEAYLKKKEAPKFARSIADEDKAVAFWALEMIDSKTEDLIAAREKDQERLIKLCDDNEEYVNVAQEYGRELMAYRTDIIIKLLQEGLVADFFKVIGDCKCAANVNKAAHAVQKVATETRGDLGVPGGIALHAIVAKLAMTKKSKTVAALLPRGVTADPVANFLEQLRSLDRVICHGLIPNAPPPSSNYNRVVVEEKVYLLAKQASLVVDTAAQHAELLSTSASGESHFLTNSAMLVSRYMAYIWYGVDQDNPFYTYETPAAERRALLDQSFRRASRQSLLTPLTTYRDTWDESKDLHSSKLLLNIYNSVDRLCEKTFTVFIYPIIRSEHFPPKADSAGEAKEAIKNDPLYRFLPMHVGGLEPLYEEIASFYLRKKLQEQAVSSKAKSAAVSDMNKQVDSRMLIREVHSDGEDEIDSRDPNRKVQVAGGLRRKAVQEADLSSSDGNESN